MNGWFGSCIGIDYSGAGHAHARLPGLRVFEADVFGSEVNERRPHPQSPLQHWSRAELADWLVERLSQASSSLGSPLLVGIDHALSFPLAYFSKHQLKRNWGAFLEDFCEHWGELRDDRSVRDVLLAQREQRQSSKVRVGESRWRRLTEDRSSGAKSVFHFGVPGTVANSTHAGLVWIHFLRTHPYLSKAIHFWPFDGWMPERGKSVVAEIYPALWNKSFPREGLTQDQHDARVVALGLREALINDELVSWLQPERWRNIRLSETERQQALIEGWILGLS